MPKNKSLISVVIINYNGLAFLPRLLDSLYSQTNENYEIIVVDSGSKDESIEYLRKEHKKLKVISYPNNGYAFACNRGAEAANGKYLVFLNIDMYLPDNFLEKMWEQYESIKGRGVKIGALSCKMVDFDCDPSSGHSTGAVKIDLFGYTYPLYNLNRNEVFSLPGSPFFIEKNTFEKLGGFDEYIFLYGEDAELSWRYNILGYKLYVNNDTYIHHYGGGVTGFPGSKWIARTLSSQLLLMFTCYSFPMLLLILPLYLLYITLILLFLLIRSNFNKEIIKELLSRLSYMAENIKGIWKFRTEVQKKRVVSDWEIFKYISPIPAFLYKKSWKRVKTK